MLFCSSRPLGRAENITALWESWNHEKRFQILGKQTPKAARLIVTDEFITSNALTVMVTHGIAGGKTYGLDQPRPYYRREAAPDYVIAPSEFMRELMAKQCGIDIERVIPLGMPRTDAYFTDDLNAVEFNGRIVRTYLYAPTFRNGIERPYPDIDFGLIDHLLTDDELLLIKRHTIGGISKTKGCRHIIDVPAYLPSTPYLLACDVLITDYSSILFDAHVANKPVVLFTKPGDGYLKNRGMYFPYPDFYSSRHATNERGLVEICRSAYEPQAVDIACREKAAGMCDGQSTKRVIEFLEGLT